MNHSSRPAKSSHPSRITLESSLQSFFYDQLSEINQRSSGPLPKEAIYYSSLVMDKFSESENYFEEIEGKTREKVLGLKLFESSELSPTEQKRCLKDIGDTALFLCGFFPESLKSKLTDTQYYQRIGQTAYLRLNSLVPSAYNRSAFYQLLSQIFDQLALTIDLVAQRVFKKGPEEELFLITTHKLQAC